jgi:hypothetical protein
MEDIQTFALEIEYNMKLKDYRQWEVDIQKERLTVEEIEYLLAKGYILTVECDNILQQLLKRGLVSHRQVVLGFDIEPQQLNLAV